MQQNTFGHDYLKIPMSIRALPVILLSRIAVTMMQRVERVISRTARDAKRLALRRPAMLHLLTTEVRSVYQLTYLSGCLTNQVIGRITAPCENNY